MLLSNVLLQVFTEKKKRIEQKQKKPNNTNLFWISD